MALATINITAGDFRRSVKRFQDLSGDVLSAGFNIFVDRIRLFANFCKTDKVFSEIHNQLANRPSVDIGTWLNEQAGMGIGRGASGLTFPIDPDERLALMYQWAALGADPEVDFIGLLPNFFSVRGSSIDAYLHAFCQAVFQPLVRELGYKLEEIEESLPQSSSEIVSPHLLQVVHNTGSFVQQIAHGNEIQQEARLSVQNADVASLFADLKLRAEAANLTPQERQESADLLDSAEAELTKPKPKKKIVEALLAALPFATAATELITAIANKLS